ncbi:Stk1 family PASTA domain-containing Ser/Thr kinase [Schaalia sp. 19OD2882]|uniref:Stk1 family PASTA domain-containing Ser/Thr kinase n=1 Tax=Schaalia sp. 19OD2882 TaxID=2794089 RepID=UPI0020A71669|nr:Stk1 family PASTA domain-containing Ser/Thr kinase [Schaalia sp. 19OD2882]
MSASDPGEGTNRGGSSVDPLIGVLVDERYRVDARLARGGMATVYVAHDQRLDRPVALKVMHPHLADSADFVARFRREARSAARIVHPGVVSVFDQGVVAGQGFLVMELVDGSNLRALLRTEGALTLGHALRITTEVLEALRAAHRVGVIHRDIKPENVLVPQDPPVRVTDFGLARAASEVSMSTTGSMLGTVAYVAPEIVTTGRADARTDIYSVGVMLFEMLTGQVPWFGENALQVAYKHVNEDLPSPSSLQEWIPREVDDLVAALGAREIAERPVDADEALDLMARTVAALPAQVLQQRSQVESSLGPDDEDESEAGVATGRTVPFAPIGRTSALPAAAVRRASSSLGREVIKTRSPDEGTSVTGPVDPSEPPPPGRGRLWRALVLALLVLGVGSAGGWYWWSEFGPGAYLILPNLDGRSMSDATERASGLGLEVVLDPQFSDQVASGTVISTDPVGGASVHKDSSVRLVVSKGVDMKIVPSLVGGTKDEAVKALTSAGLAAGSVTEEWSEQVPAGKVISQGTPPETSIAHDTPVNFVVSKGREPIAVPSVVGSKAEDAKAALEQARLTPQASEQFSDTVETGVVISQTPEAGESLHIGDAVTYIVSKGPEMVTVPDVFGMQEAQAVAAMEAAGLQVKVDRLLGGVFGTARSSDPGGGTQVRKGSTVTITIV